MTCQPAVAQGAAPAPPAARWGFEQLGEQARKLAAQPYKAAPETLPAELKSLNYDQVRDIRFKTDRALWRELKLPYEAMFFHLGKYQTQGVRINELTADGVHPLAFDRRDFDYGKNTLHPETWGNIGYAGFRLHYPLNNAQYKDELVVFQGASYFRALGAGQHYGLSARGLAIDTVGGKGEEFPRFTEFWLERPTAQSTALTVYALLDSPRATGAYRFDIRPGVQTSVQVQARLYLRASAGPIATLGIAPLTSMFAYGENQPQSVDFRPEVHDSDGLMVATQGGEWLWRPLQNPKGTLTTSFSTPALAGFGLMQRDRSFASYEDSEARYENRPSAWVTPLSAWGPGRVELMQLHTPDETNDNVVAYWVPATLPAPGQPLDISWRVDWQGKDQQRPPGAWVSQTRSGRSYAELAPNERQFIVDFTGPSLNALPADAAVKAVATADANGRIAEAHAYRVEATGAWRLALRVTQLDPVRPVELRAFLQAGKTAQPDTLSETWTYIIPPQ
ncbi:MAG TPA: glucan biosynthesis protein G [Ideonella sp.]|nr:glucan biosynthesis protein G [Ideonella sp.]